MFGHPDDDEFDARMRLTEWRPASTILAERASDYPTNGVVEGWHVGSFEPQRN